MAHKTIEVQVNRLYLDQDNARHDPLDNEPEIIAEVSKGLGEPMVGISVSSLGEGQLMAGRGW